ncbi:OLC1v1036523C1 [Oldenlandia corymbosa var. corymbosa]|uniref:OLC1v1036523C1 n=1 Tax=Oldenlandia corymbosa var. corymbosa TaxID=529605 RepID=A0AAV1CW58_OLDCO|nr:OLC1v1036523C1 [Oldenlandia corymbosa var. corymbosa]
MMISYKLFLAAAKVLVLATLASVAKIKFDNKKTVEMNESRPEILPIPGAFGPESFAFDGEGGGPYTGVSDGRIIKWLGNESRWTDFAVTSPNRIYCEGSNDHVKTEPKCGRPLGLYFSYKSGDLYIADAYLGLMVVGRDGGFAKPLAQKAQGIPFKFTNGVDVDQKSGVIYFTDSSKISQRRDYVSVILGGDNTGRLLKFDPRTSEVTVLLDKLMFPNGVALSKRGDFLLVAETTTCRILKFWLNQPKGSTQVEVIAELPGFPDNIKRNRDGDFWVAIHSPRGRLLNWILSRSWLGNFLTTKFPFDLTRAHSMLADYLRIGSGLGVKISENGDVLETIEDRKGEIWKYSSEVVEDGNGHLWVGSVKFPYAVRLKRSS